MNIITRGHIKTKDKLSESILYGSRELMMYIRTNGPPSSPAVSLCLKCICWCEAPTKRPLWGCVTNSVRKRRCSLSRVSMSERYHRAARSLCGKCVQPVFFRILNTDTSHILPPCLLFHNTQYFTVTTWSRAGKVIGPFRLLNMRLACV